MRVTNSKPIYGIHRTTLAPEGAMQLTAVVITMEHTPGAVLRWVAPAPFDFRYYTKRAPGIYSRCEL